MKINELREELVELRDTCIGSKNPDWELIVLSSHLIEKLYQYKNVEDNNSSKNSYCDNCEMI